MVGRYAVRVVSRSAPLIAAQVAGISHGVVIGILALVALPDVLAAAVRMVAAIVALATSDRRRAEVALAILTGKPLEDAEVGLSVQLGDNHYGHGRTPTNDG